MRVAFYKVDDGRLCSWTATRPKGKPFQGTTMASGSGLPHDLAQFVVEATLGFREGSGDSWPTGRRSRASSDVAARTRAGSSSVRITMRSWRPSIS